MGFEILVEVIVVVVVLDVYSLESEMWKRWIVCVRCVSQTKTIVIGVMRSRDPLFVWW